MFGFLKKVVQIAVLLVVLFALAKVSGADKTEAYKSSSMLINSVVDTGKSAVKVVKNAVTNAQKEQEKPKPHVLKRYVADPLYNGLAYLLACLREDVLRPAMVAISVVGIWFFAWKIKGKVYG